MARRSRTTGAAVRPTVRGWGFLAVAFAFIVASTLIDRREGLYVGFFLLTLVLVSAVLVWMVRPRVQVRRRFAEPSVAVGELATVRVVIEATGSARGLNRWAEQLPAGFGEQGGDLWSAGADARRFGGMIEYRVRAPRRGRYPVGPLWLGYGDPLGLAVALRPAGEVSTLTVTPRVTALDQPGVLTASGEGGRHQLYVPSNPRADELIAREYRAGDPLRRVHWRQTARRGELMVRQEEQQGDPEACVVLDTSVAPRATSSRASGAGAGAGASTSAAQAEFERAVEAAASIAVRLLADGFAVTVIETAASARRAGDRVSPRVRHYTPGAAPTLLMDLADVRLVATTPDDDVWSSVDGQLRSLGGMLPVFCVLTGTGTASAMRLAAVKGAADPAVAIVAAEPSAAASALRDSLLTGGWRAAELPAGRPLDDAWRQIAAGGTDREGARR
jgi:uncharacterized protein (DUF58 family)